MRSWKIYLEGESALDSSRSQGCSILILGSDRCFYEARFFVVGGRSFSSMPRGWCNHSHGLFFLINSHYMLWLFNFSYFSCELKLEGYSCQVLLMHFWLNVIALLFANGYFPLWSNFWNLILAILTKTSGIIVFFACIESLPRRRGKCISHRWFFLRINVYIYLFFYQRIWCSASGWNTS